MNKKQITHWLKVAVIGIALGLALQFVRAWTEPTAAPPGGNVGAPINTGANTQTKAGNLNVNGGMLIGSSTTGGNMGVGTINADQVCIRGVCNTTWPSGGGGGGCPPCTISSSSWGGEPCDSCGSHCFTPAVYAGSYACGSTVSAADIKMENAVFTVNCNNGVWN